jgi:hypothetical protein
MPSDQGIVSVRADQVIAVRDTVVAIWMSMIQATRLSAFECSGVFAERAAELDQLLLAQPLRRRLLAGHRSSSERRPALIRKLLERKRTLTVSRHLDSRDSTRHLHKLPLKRPKAALVKPQASPQPCAGPLALRC